MNWRRLLRAPAIHAAAIQAAVFVPTLALIYMLATLRVPVNLFTVALLQGTLAALLSWKLGLAPWWRPIQLLFPLALLGASALALPSTFFLVVFIVLLGLYWSTFRTQVPLYPSGPAVWRAVADLLPAARPGAPGQGAVRLIDIGSGMGGMVLDLARRRPDAACCGIELAPLPWLFSRLRARLTGSRAQFIRGDYEDMHFSQFELVFAYLSPAAMEQLWRKAAAEMRPGTFLVSYEFSFPAGPGVKTIVTTENGPPLYVWGF